MTQLNQAKWPKKLVEKITLINFSLSLFLTLDVGSMSGGRMLFSGPDYLRDHRVKVEPEHRHIGIGSMHVEGSSQANYITAEDPNNKLKHFRKSVSLNN